MSSNGTASDLARDLANDLSNDYDGFAEAYAAESESSLLNAYYSRPAVVDLAGDVTGRRILDVGCGTGPVLEMLRERGAVVTGVDPSIKMLELARKRLGEDADLHQARLSQDPDVRSLPFPDDTFDDAVACLVLHYLKDWSAPLAEIQRVLVPGGRLILALNHPFTYNIEQPDADYFAVREFTDEYTFAGQKASLTYWHKSLSGMSDAFTEAGFRISVISEPPAAPGARELFPEIMDKIPTGRFLCFLFFVLEAIA